MGVVCTEGASAACGKRMKLVKSGIDIPVKLRIALHASRVETVVREALLPAAELIATIDSRIILLCAFMEMRCVISLSR